MMMRNNLVICLLAIAFTTTRRQPSPGPVPGTKIYVQSGEPADPAQRTNWLPAPKDKDFSLFLRAYWAEPVALDGRWTPPAVEKMK